MKHGAKITLIFQSAKIGVGCLLSRWFQQVLYSLVHPQFQNALSITHTTLHIPKNTYH